LVKNTPANQNEKNDLPDKEKKKNDGGVSVSSTDAG
jgi:hypothetical protein|tara:strand:+ start:213 stop:320 length:108 start_codon:yes stop_codon:yes gene_type:complete